MATDFCPRCGEARVGSFRFCRNCRFDFDDLPLAGSGPMRPAPRPTPVAPMPDFRMPTPVAPVPPVTPVAPVAPVSADSGRTAAIAAGVAWLIAAALTAYLGFLQLSVDVLQSTGAWNLIAAAITLYFGARLLTRTRRSDLGRSAAWAALNVVFQGYQIIEGATHEAYIGATVAAGVAGVLSFVGWQAAPKEVRDEPRPPALPSDAPSGGSKVAERLVIGAIIVAILGGGYLVWAQMRTNEIVSQVGAAFPTIRPTLRPGATSRPTLAPAAGEYMARIGEGVPIVDGDGADLGTVTVTDSGRYTKVGQYLEADAGVVWIGAKIRYDAVANYDYNLFDWVAHDGEGNQYQPSGVARSPELGAGTLAAGRRAEGWVSFEVPRDVTQLWADYTTYDGTVIFSVPLL